MSTMSEDIPEIISDYSIRHSNPNYRDFLFKFVIIGDYGVGKTAIVHRYTKGQFTPNYKITIGADFCLKTLMHDEETKVQVQLWDIAGHERFGYATRIYYKYSHAALVVFDITRYDTLRSVTKWVNDLRSKICQSNGDPIPIILLANKWDIQKLCEINEDSITEVCRELQIPIWYPTSAKDGYNIDTAFESLIHMSITNKLNEEQRLISGLANGGFSISRATIEPKNYKCC